MGCKLVQVWKGMPQWVTCSSARKSALHAPRMRAPFVLVSARNRVRPAPLHGARPAACEESYRDSSPWGARCEGERNKTEGETGPETAKGPQPANFVPRPCPCPRAPGCPPGLAPPCSTGAAYALPKHPRGLAPPQPQPQGTGGHGQMPPALTQICAPLSSSHVGLRIAPMRLPLGPRAPQRAQPGPVQLCTGPQAQRIGTSGGPQQQTFSGGPRPHPPWASPPWRCD